MRKFLLLTVCILGQILAVQAQHKPTLISGIVQDEKGKPIDFATIILMDTKKNDLTDEQGALG